MRKTKEQLGQFEGAPQVADRYLFQSLRDERTKMLAQRVADLASNLPLCTSTARGTYRPGDGEVVQAVRVGSMAAYGIASRGFRT